MRGKEFGALGAELTQGGEASLSLLRGAGFSGCRLLETVAFDLLEVAVR